MIREDNHASDDGWPGLGRMVVEAIFNRDFPLVQGAVMIYAFTFVIANLVVDVLYTYLNPRIMPCSSCLEQRDR